MVSKEEIKNFLDFCLKYNHEITLYYQTVDNIKEFGFCAVGRPITIEYSEYDSIFCGRDGLKCKINEQNITKIIDDMHKCLNSDISSFIEPSLSYLNENKMLGQYYNEDDIKLDWLCIDNTDEDILLDYIQKTYL